MITVSESAKSKLESLMAESNIKTDSFLRVGVEGGGCGAGGGRTGRDEEEEESTATTGKPAGRDPR
jgi:iron-sulfur cluster assembly protein